MKFWLVYPKRKVKKPPPANSPVNSEEPVALVKPATLFASASVLSNPAAAIPAPAAKLLASKATALETKGSGDVVLSANWKSAEEPPTAVAEVWKKGVGEGNRLGLHRDGDKGHAYR
jgi:hypothetical protein